MLAVFHTRLLSSCNWALRRWCGVLAAGSWHCAKILPSAWPWSLCAIHQVEFGFSHGIQGVVKAPNNFNTFNKFFHYDFTMCYFSDFVSYIEHILEQSRLKQKPGEDLEKNRTDHHVPDLYPGTTLHSTLAQIFSRPNAHHLPVFKKIDSSAWWVFWAASVWTASRL